MGLTDCILKEIECSRDGELKKAQDIIRRIRTRQLYKLVDIILVPKYEEVRMKKVYLAGVCFCWFVLLSQWLREPACVSRPVVGSAHPWMIVS